MNGTIRRPVLVLDATGPVAAGIVAALLAIGHEVLAVTADRGGMAALRRRHVDAGARLCCLSGHDGDEAAAGRLAARIRRQARGGVQALVSCLSQPVNSARLSEFAADGLMRELELGLVPPLLQARHLWPLLPEHDGQHVLVGGVASDSAWCGYGHVAVASAARRMLVRVLHEEAKSRGIRVCMLAFEHPPVGAGTPVPTAVGRDVAALLAERGSLPGPASSIVIHRAGGFARTAPSVADSVSALLAGIATGSSDTPSLSPSRTRTLLR